MIRDLVELGGYDVIVTRNGDEAKAMLRRRQLPVLVVANLSLPRLDGFALLAELRRLSGPAGPPVIVVSSMVGTAVFADWGKDGPLKWFVGSVSIVAAILASLQTFLKFGENATLHGSAADWFAAIRRDIDEVLALPSELRGHPKHTLDSIRQEINKASQKSPELSERLWRRTARRFGVVEPPPPMARPGARDGAARPEERPELELRPRVRRKAS